MFNEHQAIEELDFDDQGAGIITSNQTLGKDFWQHLDAAKEDFSFRHEGLTNVASIPESLVNKWIREGFDFWSAPANEIVKKLKMSGHDQFVISGNKTFDH